MDGLEQALAQYGPAVLPLVIFAGAFSEGHTLVIAGGLFAHQELLSVWLAARVAAIADIDSSFAVGPAVTPAGLASWGLAG